MSVAGRIVQQSFVLQTNQFFVGDHPFLAAASTALALFRLDTAEAAPFTECERGLPQG